MLVETSKVVNINHSTKPKVTSRGSGKIYDFNNKDTASTVAFASPSNSNIIDGIVNFEDDMALRQLNRDMYYHDPICGGAIDIYSTLPYGDFSLSGLPEKEMLDKFNESLTAMRVKSLLPLMTVDYLVDGAALGIQNFDDRRKIFDTYIPINMDDAKIFHSVMYGKTPLVDITFATELRKIYSRTGDSRVDKWKEELPTIIRDVILNGGTLQPNPENTTYIPRTSQSHRHKGVSIFQRLIPTWVLEKALFRGTIQMSYRRQRGILIVTAGSDVWMPNETDMDSIVNAITLADRDPTGAILGLRPDIMFQEIRDGGNFWKHADSMDFYNQLKMKALGLSEAAFSGDTSVGAAESVMSIFNQQLRSLREYITRQFLYQNIFPTIAKQNGFEKEDRFTQTASYNDDNESYMRRNGTFKKMSDGNFIVTASDEADTEYYTPAVNYHNSLRPEASAEYMGLLDTLATKGVPIPIRTLIAAAGMSLGDILAGEDEDVNIRKTLDAYNKRIKQYLPKPEEGGGDFAAYTPLTPISAKSKRFIDRDFGEYNDIDAFNRNGKRLITRRGQKLIDERHNKVVAQAAEKIFKKLNRSARK